jgi:hypothetical protein
MRNWKSPADYKFFELTKDFTFEDWRIMRTSDYWNEIDNTPIEFKVITKIKYVINYLKNDQRKQNTTQSPRD